MEISYEWKQLFTKSDVIFESWCHVISDYPVKFGFHRTFGIGDIERFLFIKRLYIIS